MSSRRSFTLIELLIVLAIVAILSTVVVMALNPAELLRQARDSDRISDLATLNTALGTFNTDISGGFMGTSSVVYVSTPDSSPTCANLGLPALPSGWTYSCSTSQNYRKTNGSGWIPVNFSQITFGSPISSLPVDPINATSSGSYYTYVSGGSWELTSVLESAKQKSLTGAAGTDGGVSWNSYEVGNNLTLTPTALLEGGGRDSSLVGYWTFDEGSGSMAYDASGQGNNGVLKSSPTWTAAGSCKKGTCLTFSGSNYVNATSSASLNFGTGDFTAMAWVKTSVAGVQRIISKYDSVAGSGLTLYETYSPGPLAGGNIWLGGYDGIVNGSTSIPDNTWHHATLVFRRGTSTRVYLDGVDNTAAPLSTPGSNTLSNSYPLIIGGLTGGNFNGLIDDARVYNRALSAAEIAAIYNTTK